MKSIREYYAKKNIFITGATGFIGKALVEKILRCCPEVQTIYCLIRPKKGKDPHERLQDMLTDKLFDRLKKERPEFSKKLQAIAGDVQQEMLGMSPEDREFLASRLHIVFHSAATIRFDEPLRLAMDLNVLSVKRIIELCTNLTNLEALVHVSTAYANCEQRTIEEVVYPPPIEPEKLIAAMEWMDDEMINLITPKLLKGKPNTYTFTKHLAEHLLITEGKHLPFCIVRPSIVTACWREPAPGWTDNYNGPGGLYVAAGKGLMRSINIDPNIVADIVPVDVPVNTMIAAAWYTAVQNPINNATVYHITSGYVNPICWGDMEPIVINFFKRIPLESCFRRPKCHMRNNKILNDYWVFVSHMVPAYMADLGFMLLGKKPRMVRIYKKLHKAITTLDYFTHNEWQWTHKNTNILREAMSLDDQQEFYMDPREIDWPTYIENYCMGTKIYLMKEDLKGLPAAKAHLKKLRNVRYCFNTVVLVCVWRFLIARSKLAQNSWHFLIALVSRFVRFFRISASITAS